MSYSPGDQGGLSQAAPTVNAQDLFDSPAQTVAPVNTPEGQVSVHVVFVSKVSFPVALPSMIWG